MPSSPELLSSTGSFPVRASGQVTVVVVMESPVAIALASDSTGEKASPRWHDYVAPGRITRPVPGAGWRATRDITSAAGVVRRMFGTVERGHDARLQIIWRAAHEAQLRMAGERHHEPRRVHRLRAGRFRRPELDRTGSLTP